MSLRVQKAILSFVKAMSQLGVLSYITKSSGSLIVAVRMIQKIRYTLVYDHSHFTDGHTIEYLIF